jgi:hypothetical protein
MVFRFFFFINYYYCFAPHTLVVVCALVMVKRFLMDSFVLISFFSFWQKLISPCHGSFEMAGFLWSVLFLWVGVFHFGTNDFYQQLMMLNWVLAWVVVAVLN